MSNRFENKSKLTLFVLITAGTLVLIVLFEMLVGMIIGNNKSDTRYIRLRENAPHLQLKLTPSAAQLKYSENLENKAYDFSTDENGFLQPSLIHEKADITIAFIGGSTTESMYVKANKRFPYLTCQLLSNDVRKVNTLNAGVSGNDSLNSINAYLNKVVPIQPDIAILMHNINDLSTLLHEGSYWNKNEYRSPIIIEDKSLKSFLKTRLPNSFELLYRFKSIITGPVDEFAHDRSTTKTFDENHIYRLFKENLNIFISISKAKGIRPILMTQASRFSEKPDQIVIDSFKVLESLGINYAQFKTLFDGMNQLIRDVAKENNIGLIDLAKKVPQSKEYIVDTVHFNDKGSVLVAKIVAEQLNRLNSVTNLNQ